MPTRPKRSQRASRWLAYALAGAALGFGVGAIDRLVVERTLHPMTSDETAAASALARAADAFAPASAASHAAKDPANPSSKPMQMPSTPRVVHRPPPSGEIGSAPKKRSTICGRRRASWMQASASKPDRFVPSATRSTVRASANTPSPANLETLALIGARAEDPSAPAAQTSLEELLFAQAVARGIPAAPHVEHYAAKLVLATHAHRAARYGAGPRAMQALMACGRARALAAGRAAVAAEDIAASALAVLRHRIGLRFEAEAEGLTTDTVVAQTLATTSVG